MKELASKIADAVLSEISGEKVTLQISPEAIIFKAVHEGKLYARYKVNVDKLSGEDVIERI